MSSSISSGKRKRIDAAPELSNRSSKRSSLGKDTPGISSALVGFTGAMMNLSTTIEQSSKQAPASIVNQTGKIINTSTYLSAHQKSQLYRYFSKHPDEASGLPDMDPDFRQAYFEDTLEELRQHRL
jgi:hypothetical protein